TSGVNCESYSVLATKADRTSGSLELRPKTGPGSVAKLHDMTVFANGVKVTNFHQPPQDDSPYYYYGNLGGILPRFRRRTRTRNVVRLVRFGNATQVPT
ncbi:unnamed protein product, partial [Ectocarpus sp. 4 AP-2014]